MNYAGDIRFNPDTLMYEIYDGTRWLEFHNGIARAVPTEKEKALDELFGVEQMIWTVSGVALLVWNAYYVWRDVKNDSITKGTLINAAAVGCVVTTLLWISQ